MAFISLKSKKLKIVSSRVSALLFMLAFNEGVSWNHDLFDYIFPMIPSAGRCPLQDLSACHWLIDPFLMADW